uniref:Retrotransposon gag domain-containing protein n=1 Tax=Manihot esculenta TaxID=3983 RepID=A0A2C9W5T7_MANES
MRIGSRNKARNLTGEAKKPPLEDPSYAIWVIENHKVKSWLIDSMDPLLMQRFICLSTAKEIWEAIAKTFYDGSDETCLFEFNQKSFSTTQNSRPLSTYYNKFVAIFQEIDHKMTSQEETVEGVVQLHSAMARLRVHIFLNGLDPEFDHICGEILRKDPKLNLESTYTYVRREYQQRQTMEGSRPIPESSVMVAKRTQQGPSSGSTKTQSVKSNNFVCSYCGEIGHSKQRYYEIIGYPEWWDFTKNIIILHGIRAFLVEI